MKTKGFIYLISAFLVLLVASCEEDHIMTEYTGDAVGFVEEYYFQSVKADFTYLEIPVTHSSINKSGSKAEVEITLSEGTNANLVSLNTTILDFDVADTIMLQLSISHAILVEDVEYSISLTFTDTYLQHDFNGFEEVVIEFSKWRPRRITDFVGTYTVDAVSNYEPGDWDEEWEVTTEAHATDPNILLITGIAYSDVAVEATLDFDALTITIPYGVDIGDVYGYGSTILYNSNADLELVEEDLTGTLFENNNFEIDYIMMYFPDEGWDWDIFTPMFNKD